MAHSRNCQSLDYQVSDCYLQIVCDGIIIYEFSLLRLRIIDQGQHGLTGLTLFDNKTQWNASEHDMDELGLDRAQIEALRAGCI